MDSGSINPNTNRARINKKNTSVNSPKIGSLGPRSVKATEGQKTSFTPIKISYPPIDQSLKNKDVEDLQGLKEWAKKELANKGYSDSEVNIIINEGPLDKESIKNSILERQNKKDAQKTLNQVVEIMETKGRGFWKEKQGDTYTIHYPTERFINYLQKIQLKCPSKEEFIGWAKATEAKDPKLAKKLYAAINPGNNTTSKATPKSPASKTLESPTPSRPSIQQTSTENRGVPTPPPPPPPPPVPNIPATAAGAVPPPPPPPPAPNTPATAAGVVPPPPPPSGQHEESEHSSFVDELNSKFKNGDVKRGLKKTNNRKNYKDDARQAINEHKEASELQVTSGHQVLLMSSWDDIRVQLATKIANTGGAKCDNPHINQIMEEHAQLIGQTGYIEATAPEKFVEKDGQYINVNKGKTIKKAKYEAYVAGRRADYDFMGVKTAGQAPIGGGTDFNTNIMEFIDKHLHKMAKEAEENNTTLLSDMRDKFGISPTIKSPAQLLIDWPVLANKLEKTGASASWLTKEEITEEFIDDLINYESNPKPFEKHLNKMFIKQVAAIKRQMAPIIQMAKAINVDLTPVTNELDKVISADQPKAEPHKEPTQIERSQGSSEKDSLAAAHQQESHQAEPLPAEEEARSVNVSLPKANSSHSMPTHYLSEATSTMLKERLQNAEMYTSLRSFFSDFLERKFENWNKVSERIQALGELEQKQLIQQLQAMKGEIQGDDREVLDHGIALATHALEVWKKPGNSFTKPGGKSQPSQA